MDINKVKNLTILKDSAFSGKETSRKGVENVIEEVPADSFHHVTVLRLFSGKRLRGCDYPI
ncbi:hypothetical protein J7K07_01715 [Candidatus Bathyarchaeota archaeon]|nr:hypothetical protein [Candidatus Bathyarchaeota archaeon]